jgi:hypothetical protein
LRFSIEATASSFFLMSVALAGSEEQSASKANVKQRWNGFTQVPPFDQLVS